MKSEAWMINNISKKWLLAAGLFLACLPAVAENMTISPSINAYPSPWKWTNEAWNADDKPYQQIRAEIDAAIKAGKKPIDLVNLYRTQAKTEPYQDPYQDPYKPQTPYNPQAEFRWGYAVYQATLNDPKFANSPEVARAFESMEFFPFPHSYQFARTLFLLTGDLTPDSRLQTVGERLMKRNPKDYPVMRTLVGIINPGKSEAEKQKALGYAHTLIQVDPKSPKGYRALGWVYFGLWMKSKSPEDRKLATDAYNRCLQLLPANDPYRVSIANSFKIMTILANAKPLP